MFLTKSSNPISETEHVKKARLGQTFEREEHKSNIQVGQAGQIKEGTPWASSHEGQGQGTEVDKVDQVVRWVDRKEVRLGGEEGLEAGSGRGRGVGGVGEVGGERGADGRACRSA